MSTWRRKAIEAVPELRDRIEQSWSPMAAWIELRSLFEQAMKNGDIQRARRIMDYARYCLAAPNADVNTAVAVGFIEHLADDEATRARLPELISVREFNDWREIMSYHADDQVLESLNAAFRSKTARPRKSS
ncbi:hypothetical protein CAL29_06750 [Bordetella genomosp. 10]|uniref:DUF7674 domain-containing protein n=1 Tax=Bordetella genomosp. 10 TaxID=1416804 RepID=A0A261SLL5_9BORD|nr:hypothetical protein [Bordetella genomosp. 10]OZI38045.1 hypothetical protein CAL29_06750 [Bordetella genomosp. 10]